MSEGSSCRTRCCRHRTKRQLMTHAAARVVWLKRHPIPRHAAPTTHTSTSTVAMMYHVWNGASRNRCPCSVAAVPVARCAFSPRVCCFSMPSARCGSPVVDVVTCFSKSCAHKRHGNNRCERQRTH